MTEQHPLTDEIAKELSSWHLDILDPYLIEWLTENLCYIQEDGLVRYVYGDGFATIATHEVVRDLKKAMLPQEDNL